MSIEAFVNNMNKGKNAVSNYEIMTEKTRDLFLTYDTAAMAEKMGLSEDEGYIYAHYISRLYRVNKKDGLVEVQPENTQSWEKAAYEDALTLYDILGYGQAGAAPAGEFLQIQNLSDVHNARSYAGSGMNDRYGKEYEGRVQTLQKALSALGGVPFGKGDVSMRLPFFEKMDVVISFWDADDEFPASLNILVDKNILQYMHYETIWYAAGGLMKRVKEAAQAAERKDTTC